MNKYFGRGMILWYDLIDVDQERERRRAFLNAVMNFCVP
jgi:hypothetical protein